MSVHAPAVLSRLRALPVAGHTSPARLLRLDLEHVVCDGKPLAELVAEFAGQLRQIKGALESRDFVTLADILAYEMNETSARWGAAVAALRDSILAPH